VSAFFLVILRIWSLSLKLEFLKNKVKVETSIFLSDDILSAIDKLSEQYQNRSEWIKMALQSFIAQIKNEKNLEDVDIINKNATRLNKEALDAFTYQVDL
jgi:metal-responsive CopG/Arc/MetJ family transcriptional regulator